MVYAIIICALTAYLLGNLNGSVCISALVAGDDVRKHGSGNAGLTNFFRSYGGASTFLVMLVDVAKTVLACLSCGLIMESFGYGYEGMMLGAVAVSVGHDFPALLGFKGGKGILCGAATGLMVDLRVFAIIMTVFILVVFLTRLVSLGSVLAATTFAVCVVVFYWGDWTACILAVIAAGFVVFRHRGNIVRLVKGTESKLTFHKK